jgi:Na+/melibiose symporter-like transporter
VLVIVCTLIAYLGNYLVTSIIFKWGMSYVDNHKRASFGASKEMVSLICGMVFTLAIGFTYDKYEETGNVTGGFLFLAAGILACSLLDLVCLLLMKKPEVSKSEEKKEPISAVLGKLLKNKAFICLLVIGVLYYVSVYMINSFMGAYKTGDLGFSIGQIQIINTVGVLFRFAISKPMGKFSDKTSHSVGLFVGCVMLTACFFFNIFTAPSSRWMIYVYALLYNGALAAIHQNFLNITFDYVETEYFVQATSIKAAISGISGFAATLIGAGILKRVQENSNMVFGIEMRAQQLLSAISFVIMLVLCAFMFFVFRKLKKINE